MCLGVLALQDFGIGEIGNLGDRKPENPAARDQPGWRQNEKSLRRQLHQLGRVLELATGGVDVAAPWSPDVGGDSRSGEDVLKRQDSLLRRSRERNFWPRIQRDQVHLGPQTSDELNHFARVLHVVVQATQQDVLKGEPLAIAQGGTREARPSTSRWSTFL